METPNCLAISPVEIAYSRLIEDEKYSSGSSESECTNLALPQKKRNFAPILVHSFWICNCGGTRQCVVKAHVRDGVVIRVEPDDRYNQHAGREDRFLFGNDLILNNIQQPSQKYFV